MRVAPRVPLSDAERSWLLRCERSRSVPLRLVLRAKIVLLAAEAMKNKDIAIRLRIDRAVVARWRSRFAARGLAGIWQRGGWLRTGACRTAAYVGDECRKDHTGRSR